MRFVFTPVGLAVACTSVAAFAYNPATYTVSVAGQNGPVTVEVKTSADKILSVKILSQKETQGIGSEAIEALPAEILKAQKADVLAVTGASVTSKAIVEAVKSGKRYQNWNF